MIIPQSKPWHDECHRLRADGLSLRALAKRFRVSDSAIRYALDPDGEKAKRQGRVSRQVARKKQRKNYYGMPHTPRAMPAPASKATPNSISKEEQNEAIRAFAKHEIDRVELMKRITPRDKWSRAELLRVEL